MTPAPRRSEPTEATDRRDGRGEGLAVFLIALGSAWCVGNVGAVVGELSGDFDISLATIGLLSGTLLLGFSVPGTVLTPLIAERLTIVRTVMLAAILCAVGNVIFAVTPGFAGLVIAPRGRGVWRRHCGGGGPRLRQGHGRDQACRPLRRRGSTRDRRWARGGRDPRRPRCRLAAHVPTLRRRGGVADSVPDRTHRAELCASSRRHRVRQARAGQRAGLAARRALHRDLLGAVDTRLLARPLPERRQRARRGGRGHAQLRDVRRLRRRPGGGRPARATRREPGATGRSRPPPGRRGTRNPRARRLARIRARRDGRRRDRLRCSLRDRDRAGAAPLPHRADRARGAREPRRHGAPGAAGPADRLAGSTPATAPRSFSPSRRWWPSPGSSTYGRSRARWSRRLRRRARFGRESCDRCRR